MNRRLSEQAYLLRQQGITSHIRQPIPAHARRRGRSKRDLSNFAVTFCGAPVTAYDFEQHEASRLQANIDLGWPVCEECLRLALRENESRKCKRCGEPEDGGQFGWFDTERGLSCNSCGSNPITGRRRRR